MVAWRSYACAIGKTTSMRESSCSALEVTSPSRANEPARSSDQVSSPMASSAFEVSTWSVSPRATSGASSSAPRALAPRPGAPTMPVSPVAPIAAASDSSGARPLATSDGCARSAAGPSPLRELWTSPRCDIGSPLSQVVVPRHRPRRPIALGARHRLETTAIAQPAAVDLGIGSRYQAEHRLGAAVDLDIAADGAAVTHRGRTDEVPGPRLEPVLAAGQRADRAPLDRVTAEDRGVRLAVQCGDLAVGAALDGGQRRVSRDLLVKPDAAEAHDAAFAVQHDLRPERIGLLLVTLFFGEAGSAWAVSEGVVLQGTLATLVANRAVERVVGEQELEHAVLSGDDVWRVGVDDHVGSDGCGTGGLQAGQFLDLHQAHAAGADGLQPGLVAEDRDLEPDQLGGPDEQHALRRGQLLAVDGETQRVRSLSHT